MNSKILSIVSLGAKAYPNSLKKVLEYGTSGFRDKGSILPHVMYRIGVLATLISKVKRGVTIGVMITASHNPEEDNGVKLCDEYGRMIESEWETFATRIANASDQDLSKELQHLYEVKNIDDSVTGSIYLGRDTRCSSPALAAAVAAGVKVLDGKLCDYGLVTTPQLHFLVCCKNSDCAYGLDTREGYYKKLSKAYIQLNNIENSAKYVPEVFVDGANGVGACAVKELFPYIEKYLKIELFNDGCENLNFECGADYVKIKQCPPAGTEMNPFRRYLSFDGDADRLIYFYLDDNLKFHMLDGDKIAVLVADYLKTMLKLAKLDLELRVVQTAYSNGSSTKYIKEKLGISVSCAQTGVKFVHHEASKYDIGIYFEANGHGTVLFHQNAKQKIAEKAKDNSSSGEERSNCVNLLHFIDLINETVGDALSDFLLVETILRRRNWTISDWDSIYCDLPQRQLKITVDNREVFSTTAAGISIKPEGLQDKLNALVSKYPNARAFVRPSGTEDIVRVYAEADTQEQCDSLANDVAEIVKELNNDK